MYLLVTSEPFAEKLNAWFMGLLIRKDRLWKEGNNVTSEREGKI